MMAEQKPRPVTATSEPVLAWLLKVDPTLSARPQMQLEALPLLRRIAESK